MKHSENPSAQTHLEATPASLNQLIQKSRTLTGTAFLVTTLAATACSGEDEAAPDEPRGWGCVSVLDQNDSPMQNCVFDYELSDEGKDFMESDSFTACKKGELFIYGAPGKSRIKAECGKLAGSITTKIDEARGNQDGMLEANDTQSTHLEGSLCSSDTPMVIYEQTLEDLKSNQVSLGDYLAFMSVLRCGGGSRYDRKDIAESTVINISRDCGNKTSDCDGAEGWKYAEVMNEQKGVLSGDGEQLHFMVETHPEKVAAGEQETINITIRNEKDQQEITLPIEIRGPKAN